MTIYRLIITEKPSVARHIAELLGARSKMGAFLQGERDIVSWCVGHLVTLASAETYDPSYAAWKKEDLPILPAPWSYDIRPAVRKQFDAVKGLMLRPDVDQVVCATDAGREGELIFRLVYAMAGCQKPVMRLWIHSMEDAAIRQGFEQLSPSGVYDRLYHAALCRAQADWLVGINATRLFSTLYHKRLVVGRVVSPTLAMLVQREADRQSFASEPYYQVLLDIGFDLKSERMKDKADAEALAASCRGKEVLIQSVRQAERLERAPLLYDLTQLQRDANRQLGFTARQTLDYLQSLYEKKLCTYPRTDSRYLSEDMSDKVRSLVKMAAAIAQAASPVLPALAQVIDSGKVSDHHAILLTGEADAKTVSALPQGEKKIVKLIALRTIQALSPPAKLMETTISADCEGHTFSARFSAVTAPGWRATLNEKIPKAAPEAREGQRLSVQDACSQEGRTKPPASYTEDTLLEAMETAGAGEIPQEAERRGIGTPATRAHMIEKLIALGLAERKKLLKNMYIMPTQAGTALATILPEQLQSPLLTAEWEHRLLLVERGELSPDDFRAEVADMVGDIVRNYQKLPGSEALFPEDRPVVGNCPRCGKPVRAFRKGFFCTDRCGFGLYKEDRFFARKKITLTEEQVAALLKDGAVRIDGIYSEKTGNLYSADVLMEDTGKYVNYRLAFDRKGEGKA